MLGMGATRTTIAVQRFLDELAGASSPADDPVVRALLERSVDRLHMLCGRLLYRSYPRLTRRPAYLDTDDLLGAVVGRLIRALGQVKPRSVREFFGLANRHIRWELNDLARRIDALPASQGYAAEPQDQQPSTSSGDTATLRRVLGAIEALPEEDREVFELVRIQGMTHGEAAEVLEVAERTIQRRLRRCLLALTESVGDLVADDRLAEGQDDGVDAAEGSAP